MLESGLRVLKSVTRAFPNWYMSLGRRVGPVQSSYPRSSSVAPRSSSFAKKVGAKTLLFVSPPFHFTHTIAMRPLSKEENPKKASPLKNLKFWWGLVCVWAEDNEFGDEDNEFG